MHNVVQANFGPKAPPKFTTVEVRTFKDLRFDGDKELPARIIEQHVEVPFQGTEPNPPFSCRYIGYYIATEVQYRQQQTPEGLVNVPVGERHVRKQFEFPQAMTELRLMFEQYEIIAEAAFNRDNPNQTQLAVPQKSGLIL